MKILFLSHIYKSVHDVLLKGISEVFTRRNYSVDYEPQESVSYDCLLVFNRKALRAHEEQLRKQRAPIIYLFCLSDMAGEYIVSNVVTRTIIIKDKVLNTNHLYDAPVFYQDMIFPAYSPKKLITQNDKPLLYIRIEDNYLNELTFLKLLPLLNIKDRYLIYYQSNRPIGKYLVNPHIKFIPGKQDISEKINEADIVISSGMVAAFAVQQGKKTIVVGERGYGGLVTSENLEYHLSNCFQGRNGGKLDENIPLQLVQKAIEKEETNILKTQEHFSFMQTQNENKFINQIEKIISINSRIRLNDSDLHYMINPDYDIFKRKKRIWISKQVFGTLYKSVNESEGTVIYAFQHPRSLREVLNTFPSEYEENIKEYIQELIEEKILIPVEMTNNKNVLIRENMKNKFVFDIVLSVGNDCRPAYYIKNHNLKYWKNPLDWMKDYSLDTVIHLYKSEFEDFFSDFIEDKQQKTHCYIDIKNNITSVHYDDIGNNNKAFREKMKCQFEEIYKVLLNANKVCFISNRNEDIDVFKKFMKTMGEIYSGKITYINIRNQEEKENPGISQYEEKISDKLEFIEYVFKDVHPNGSDPKINIDAWRGNYILWHNIMKNISIKSNEIGRIN